MPRHRIRILAALCIVCSVRGTDTGVDAVIAGDTKLTAPSSSMLELTEENFQQEVNNRTTPILVEFYATWCGVCKTIKKEYERAAWLANNLSMPVTIARIDGHKYRDVSDAYDVKSLPAFFLFNNGERESFPTLTTGEAFVAGLSKLLGMDHDIVPAKVFDDGNVTDILSWLFWRGTNDGRILTTIVLFKPSAVPEEGRQHAKALEDTFVATAKELMRFSNLRFAYATAENVMEEFDVPTDRYTLLMYKDHDEGRVEYTGELAQEALQNWVIRQDTPLVTQVTHWTLKSHRKKVPHLALFFMTEKQIEDQVSVKRVHGALQQIAYALEAKGYFKRGEFTMGYTNGNKYKSWMNFFKLPEDRIPAISVENTWEEVYYAGLDISVAGACEGVPGDSEVRLETFCPGAEARNTALDKAQEAAEVTPDGDFVQHRVKEAPLTWINVPDAEVYQFLERYFTGLLQPIEVKEE